MRKKSIAVLWMVYIMILGTMPVISHAQSENILYFCEDFNTATNSRYVKSMTFNPLTNEIYITNDGYATIAMKGVESSQNPGIIKNFYDITPSGNVVIEADIMLKNIGGCSPRIAIRSPKDTSGSEVYPISISSSGKVTARDGSVILSAVEEGKFYTYSLCFDMVNGVYDVYLDGSLKAKDINFCENLSYDFTEISMLHFTTRYADSTCNTEYCVDNIKVYSGTEPLQANSFNSTNWQLAAVDNTVITTQMIKATSKNILAFYPDAKKALVYGEYRSISPVCTFEGNDTMIPADFLKSVLGGTYLKDYNKSYISPDDILAKTDLNVYSDKTGLVIISKDDISLDWYNDAIYLSALAGEMIYERPSGISIIESVKKLFPNNSHPRLLVNGSTFDEIKSEIQTNPIKAKWYQDIKKQADAYLDQSVASFPETITPTTSFIDQAIELKEMAPCLAFVYHMEGKDTKYSSRLIAEIDAWINQEQWSPYSMLALGRAVNGLAFAYDWIYDEIPETTKTNLKKAISERFYSEVFKDYYNITPVSRSYKWAQRTIGDNWNSTINCAVIMSAVAMGDEPEYTDECATLINEALYSIESAFDQLAPDGAWFEGAGYWTPTARSMVWTMETLRNATGSDYGLFNVPGMKYAGYYLYEMFGANAIFNFNFAAERAYPEPSLLYFANRLNDDSLKQLCIDHYDKYKGEENIYMTADALILAGDIPTETVDVSLPLDAYYRRTEAVSMRNSWNNDEMIYVGFHSGDNSAQNAQLDIGTFVIDAYGDRFINDFGPEKYSITDPCGNIFKAYMNRAEGANSYIINPSKDYYDQELSACCYMNRFETNEKSALAISDITAAYGDKVKSAVRGIKFTDNRSRIILQDEIKCQYASDIYWGMHTPASVELSEDKKTAVLDINGNKMEIKILSEQGEFSLDKAEPLPECYILEGQTPHPDITKIAMKFSEATDVNITLCFTPLGTDESFPVDYPEVLSMSEWSLDTLSVSDISFKKSESSVSLTVSKYGTNTVEPKNLTLFMAAYEDGYLTDLANDNKELLSNGDTVFQTSFADNFVYGEKTIKVFLIDESNMTPYLINTNLN